MSINKSSLGDGTERDASEAGLSARNISDGEMNDGRNFSGLSGPTPADVGSREHAANRQAVEARRVISEAGDLDMTDLLAPDLYSSDASTRELARTQMKAQQMANQLINNGAQRVVTDAYMQPNEASMLMEQEAYNPAPTNDGWGVVKKHARLKSGKQIPVFMVEDALTGMSTGKKYRLSSVAEKIAVVLNATQNMDDARIKMIEAAYDQHVGLMRAINEAKRSNNSSKVSTLESKLAMVNSKLGLT